MVEMLERWSIMSLNFTAIMPIWIINEEGMKLTKAAIESLGEIDLFLIDNNSDTRFIPQLLNFQPKVYLRNSSNLGFAKAMNEGFKLAPAGIVLCVNNDIRVSPNYKEIITEAFKIDPQVKTVHPRMLNYYDSFVYGNQIVPTGKERWCQGSLFAIKHDPASPVYYDENFLNSMDDWELFARIRDTGLRTCYTNMCCFQHHHSFTQKQIPEREVNDLRNKEYYKQKRGEYAEDEFARKYPEQMSQDYWEGFD